MTLTRPWRRMILHFSHIFFTLGLTFICEKSYLFRKSQTMRPLVKS